MPKYYKIVLNNVFLKVRRNEVVYAVYENGKYYELLTNKEIFMIYDGKFHDKNDLQDSGCKLIGTFSQEIGGEDVSLFLRFITPIGKERIINRINNMEKSINDVINIDNEIENSKIKTMTKYDFLKKF